MPALPFLRAVEPGKTAGKVVVEMEDYARSLIHNKVSGLGISSLGEEKKNKFGRG